MNRRRARGAVPSIVGVVLAGVVTLVLVLIDGSGLGNRDTPMAMLGMASFLFGVLVAFAIDGARTRLAILQDALKRGDANLLAIYGLLELFGAEAEKEVRALLDRHLQAQIDYRLVDFHESNASYLRIGRAVRSLPISSGKQTVAFDQLLTQVLELGANRALVESHVRKRITLWEWVGLGLLVLVQLTALVQVGGESIVWATAAGVMASVLVLLLVLLWRLDTLRLGEVSWIWDPLTRLFLNLGLRPYYPRSLLLEGRVVPVEPYRIADSGSYPPTEGKTVTWVPAKNAEEARQGGE